VVFLVSNDHKHIGGPGKTTIPYSKLLQRFIFDREPVTIPSGNVTGVIQIFLREWFLPKRQKPGRTGHDAPKGRDAY
jgi:hypothetical protein